MTGKPSSLSSPPASEANPAFFAPLVVCVGLGSLLMYRDPTAVPVRDLAFAGGYPLYLCVANKVCFLSDQNQNDATSEKFSVKPRLSLGKGQFRGKPAFTAYMMIFNVVTVLSPLLFIFISSASSSSIPASVSPLVLLLAQVAMESLTISFHDVPRILVPIGFNAFRLLSLYDWLLVAYQEFILLTQQQQPTSAATVFEFSSMYSVQFGGLILAALNLILWSYNLFIFLLLRVLPVYFDKNDTPQIDMAYTVIPIPKSTKSDRTKSN